MRRERHVCPSRPSQPSQPPTLEQLQQIENVRRGGKALFHLHARFVVQSIWPRLNELPQVTHETETPGQEGGWPMRLEIAESDWSELLSKLKFRHPVMDRVPWPDLPPAFRRSQDHLDDAWSYYRRNDPAGTLVACHKAFECLGFDLMGKEVQRTEMLELLMDNAEPEKSKRPILTV